jgi:site-specific recombinase XerD
VVVTVRHACAEFLKDATARGLREPTLYKYRLPFKQLQEFADRAGLDALTQLDLEAVRNFPATWPNRNIADRKKLEATKAFFRFCWESGWISHNPASKLKAPRTMEPPTMPFTREEIDRTLAACDNCGHASPRAPNQRKAAFVHREDWNTCVLSLTWLLGDRAGNGAEFKFATFLLERGSEAKILRW